MECPTDSKATTSALLPPLVPVQTHQASPERSQTSQQAQGNPGSRKISTCVQLLAAGVAAAVSAFAVQPLDVLKTRLQVTRLNPSSNVQRTIAGSLYGIFKAEGVRGLYRGAVPTLMSVVPSISLYFTLYYNFKNRLGCPTGNSSQDMLRQSVAAGLASSCTSAITNPLWLIKTRLQVQHTFQFASTSVHSGGVALPKYRGTVHAFKSIVREEGVMGLYKGLGVSLLASCQAMVQFPLYELLKKETVCNDSSDVRRTVAFLASSAIASSIASMVTYPAEVMRSRMQAHGMTRSSASNTIGRTFKTLWVQEGFKGLYRGLGTNLMRLTPSHAISFTVYEYIIKSVSDSRFYNGSTHTSQPVVVEQPTPSASLHAKFTDSRASPVPFGQAMYMAANFIG